MICGSHELTTFFFVNMFQSESPALTPFGRMFLLLYIVLTLLSRVAIVPKMRINSSPNEPVRIVNWVCFQANSYTVLIQILAHAVGPV